MATQRYEKQVISKAAVLTSVSAAPFTVRGCSLVDRGGKKENLSLYNVVFRNCAATAAWANHI